MQMILEGVPVAFSTVLEFKIVLSLILVCQQRLDNKVYPVILPIAGWENDSCLSYGYLCSSERKRLSGELSIS